MPKLNYHHYAFLATFIWSTSYVTTKVVMTSYTAAPFASLRILVAAIALMGVMIARKMPLLPPRKDWHLFIISALTGHSLYNYTFNTGTSLTGPTTSCIFISMSPIFIALFALILFGEKLRPLSWLAILLSFAGVLIMTLWNGEMSMNRGIYWMLAAVMLVSSYHLLQRKVSRKYEPLPILAYTFMAAALILSFFLPAAFREMRTAPAWHTAIIVYMGIFPSAISFLVWVRAIASAPKISYVTNYLFLTPFLALLFEFTLLSQLPGTGILIGGAVILASLALFKYADKNK